MYSSISRGYCRLHLFSARPENFSRKLFVYFNDPTIFVHQKTTSFIHRKTFSSENNKPTILSTTSSSHWTWKNQCIYLTAKNARKYLDNYDNILLDCDGVLWGTDHKAKIKNIGKALKKLKDCGKRLLFVTNNSLHSKETILDKFTSFGYKNVCEDDEMFCVSAASALYLKEVLKIKGSVYMIGSQAMDKELRSVGISCFGLGPDPDPVTRNMAEMLKARFRDDVEAVLVGFDEHLNYNKLYKAASYIRRSQGRCYYLATSNIETGTWIGCEHYRPATGVIVNSVTVACGQQPMIIGKPSRFLYDCILSKYPNLEKERTIMIGDSLKADVTFAQNVGIDSALVLSGATDFNTLSRTINEKKPTFYFDSIGILAEAL